VLTDKLSNARSALQDFVEHAQTLKDSNSAGLQQHNCLEFI
jgi:hypothetical protein